MPVVFSASGLASAPPSCNLKKKKPENPQLPAFLGGCGQDGRGLQPAPCPLPGSQVFLDAVPHLTRQHPLGTGQEGPAETPVGSREQQAVGRARQPAEGLWAHRAGQGLVVNPQRPYPACPPDTVGMDKWSPPTAPQGKSRGWKLGPQPVLQGLGEGTGQPCSQAGTPGPQVWASPVEASRWGPWEE